MSHNTFVKTIACIVSAPVMVMAIAMASYQQSAYAFSPNTAVADTASTQTITQPAEVQALLPSAMLISGIYETYSFQLNNAQSRSMHYFYASPSDSSYWGSDLFGFSTLSSDTSTYMYIDDNWSSCFYDFKAIFADGAETTHYDINICELSGYTF